MVEGSSKTHPWRADRELRVQQAQGAIRSQFRDIAATEIIALDSGWDNDVFLVDGTWIFRFPRRRKVAEGLDREMAASALADDALASLEVRTPRIAKVGSPCEFFPYHFTGYERLPGAPAEDLPDLHSTAADLGRQMGRILSRLHAIPAERAREAGLDAAGDGAPEWYDEAVRISNDLERREGPEIRSALGWLRDGPALPPRYDGPARFLHNDICPDHALMDPGRRRITGLLDFGDAELGDPALDFVMLPAWLGPAGLDAALASYERERDPGLRDRVGFLARVTSLTWLHDAHLQGGDTAKHRQWVRRAFQLADDL